MAENKRLTAEEAAEIRRLYSDGKRPKLILLQFAISRKTLWMVVNGRTHKETA